MQNHHFAPTARKAEDAASATPAPAKARLFHLDLTVDPKGRPTQDGTLRCEPGEDHRKHTFHWLVYVAPALGGIKTLSAACDLWRWHEGEWRSVFVPGATFTPEELSAQGWRYCAPSVQVFVKIAPSPADRIGALVCADERPSAKAGGMVPTKRNRGLASAGPAQVSRRSIR